MIGRTALAALALLMTSCPKTQEPASPYDLPPVTSGGVEPTEVRSAVPLTLSVETVEPPDDAELATTIEDAIAFDHYAALNACETTSAGWETGFEVGTVSIGFTLEPAGTTSDVSVVLTTGNPAGTFTSCLVEAVRSMVLDGVDIEEPVTLQLMLKYGK